ncbi:MAG: beta-lactamase hydrolase domain-containing protein [Vicinamibacteraceae bacterium]
MRRRAVAFAAALIGSATLLHAVAIGRQAEQQQALPGARNYTRVDATVACGGATSGEAFPELKRQGFASVINLRQPSEPGVPEEAALVKAAGLEYIHLPMDGSAPDPAVVDEFLAAVADESNQPVYIHCASANRVGAVWAIKRVLQDDWPLDKAFAEADAIGLRSPGLRQFATEYIKTHQQ